MSESPHPRRRSNVRRANVTACVRCKSRKQRCDQNVPACSNCDKAGVECVSTDVDGRVVPRSYIRSLEDKVAHLEMLLASHGIRDDGSAISPSSFRDNASLPEQSVQTDGHQTMFEPRLGLPGQLPLLKLLLPDLGRLEGSTSQEPRSQRYQALVDTLPFEANASLPSRSAAQELATAYFEYSDSNVPILARTLFASTLGDVYSNSEPKADFQTLMVFAVAICLVNEGSALSSPIAEAYFSSAMRLFSDDLVQQRKHDLDHLERLLLIIQFTTLASNLPVAWHCLGLAMRLAIGLGLHADQSTAVDQTDVIRRRCLFWATYSFDRALALVLHRPLQLNDEAIETPLPGVDLNDERGLVSHHFLLYRQLESEMYQTLHQKQPLNGSVLNLRAWRKSMEIRLLQWAANRPVRSASSRLAPEELVDGMLSNAFVVLFSPSRHLPTLFEDELTTLATHCLLSIDCYKAFFKSGKLRFYWRTCHNLFRAGVALIHCMRHCQSDTLDGISMEQMRTGSSTCATVLWGMVERYSTGKAFRDVFDEILASTSRPQSQGLDHLGTAGGLNFSTYLSQPMDCIFGIDFDQQSIDGLLCELTGHPLPPNPPAPESM